jgi:hypothetical protein
MVLASNGLPLWDGVADIQIRQALSGEEAKWRASRAKAIRQCDIEGRRHPQSASLNPPFAVSTC